jgi:hypothetical protein
MLGVFALHASGAVRAFNFPDSSSTTQVAGASRDIGCAACAVCRELVVHMYEWMRQGDRTPAEVKLGCQRPLRCLFDAGIYDPFCNS